MNMALRRLLIRDNIGPISFRRFRFYSVRGLIGATGKWKHFVSFQYQSEMRVRRTVPKEIGKQFNRSLASMSDAGLI